MKLFNTFGSVLWLIAAPLSQAVETNAPISSKQMQAIYDEVKTPFKYGIVIEPPAGKKVDSPNVFCHGDKWFMVYVQLENDPQGYTTQLAESDDLLHWKPLGTILPRGASNTWDCANAGGGVALFDTQWGGSNTLQTYDGRYWLSYLGGPNPGYEKLPSSIGIGRCKFLSVICCSSIRPSPSGVRRSEGERSEPSGVEPRKGMDVPRTKNWSRAGHRGFLLGCAKHIQHQTIP